MRWGFFLVTAEPVTQTPFLKGKKKANKYWFLITPGTISSKSKTACNKLRSRTYQRLNNPSKDRKRVIHLCICKVYAEVSISSFSWISQRNQSLIQTGL